MKTLKHSLFILLFIALNSVPTLGASICEKADTMHKLFLPKTKGANQQKALQKEKSQKPSFFQRLALTLIEKKLQKLPDKRQDERKTHWTAWASLGAGCLALLVMLVLAILKSAYLAPIAAVIALLAILFGLVGLDIISKKSDKYKGKGKITWVLIIALSFCVFLMFAYSIVNSTFN